MISIVKSMNINSLDDLDICLWIYKFDKDALRYAKTAGFNCVLYLMLHPRPRNNFVPELLKSHVNKIHEYGLKVYQVWAYQPKCATLKDCFEWWKTRYRYFWNTSIGLIYWDGIYIDDIHIYLQKRGFQSVDYNTKAIERVFNFTKRIYEAFAQATNIEEVKKVIELNNITNFDYYSSLDYIPSPRLYPKTVKERGIYIWLYSAVNWKNRNLTRIEIIKYIRKIFLYAKIYNMKRIVVFSWDPANELHPLCLRDYSWIKTIIENEISNLKAYFIIVNVLNRAGALSMLPILIILFLRLVEYLFIVS